MKSLLHLFLIPILLMLGSCTTTPSQRFQPSKTDRIYVFDSRNQTYYECPYFRGLRFEKAPELPTVPKYLFSNHDAVTDILVKSLEEHRLALRRDREYANQFFVDFIESCKR